MRADGQKTPEVREFAGDSAADYLLIVQDDGREETGVDIKLNGETVIASGRLKGFKVAEIKQSVVLGASNRMTVLPLGKTGAKVVVWILSGSKVVTSAGAVIRAGGDGAVVTVQPGAVASGSVLVQAYDSVRLQTQKFPVSRHTLRLRVFAANATFGQGAAIALSLPTTTALPANQLPLVEVVVEGVAQKLWGEAIPVSGAVSIAIPSSAIGEALQPTDSLELLMTVVALEDVGQNAVGGGE
ncbi:MAG: hypothetical protein IPG75_19765 [Gemmatimonadetes bacterium]|nr:hypothetical protein [Gemmatimonadota bacterium]